MRNSAETSTYARYIGRVGALAAALGIGAAVVGAPAPAWAGPDGEGSGAASTSGSSETGSSQSRPARTKSGNADKKHRTQRDSPARASHTSDPASDHATATSAAAPGAEAPAPSSGHAARPARPKIRKSLPALTTSRPAVTHTLPTLPAGAPRAVSTAAPQALSAVSPPSTTTVTPTTTLTAPTAGVVVTAVTPAQTTVRPSPLHQFVVAALRIFGYDPEAADPGPENRQHPLLALVWGVYRRIESSFDNATPTVGAATVTSTSLTADGKIVVSGTLSAADADGDALRYTVSGAQHGTVTIGDNGAFTYTYAPASGFSGTDTFTVSVSDAGWHLHGLAGLFRSDGGHARTATIAVTIANSAPAVTAVVGPHDNADGRVTGSVTLTDLDGDHLGSSASTSPRGTLQVQITALDATTSRLDYTYVPDADARHAAAADSATTAQTTDTLSIAVTDGRGGALTIPLTAGIASANQNPGSTGEVVVNTADANGVVTGDLKVSDPDGDPLSGAKTTGKGTLTVRTDGTFSYVPTTEARQNAGQPGGEADALTVTVTDGHGGSIDVPVTVPIAALPTDPTNHAPVVGAPGYTITGVDTNTGAVHGQLHVTDPDVNPLSYSISVDPRYGSVSVDVDGSFVYQPSMGSRLAPNAIGSDAFTVAVSDGTNTAVTVTVAAVPVTHTTLTVAGTYPIVDDTAGHVLALSPDGTRLFVTNPSHGSVKVINADPTSGHLGDVLVTIPIVNATALAIDPDGTHLYIAAQGATTASISTVDIDDTSPTAYTVTATHVLPLSGYHISDLAVSSDGTRLYATAFTITDSVATGPIATDGVLVTLGASDGYVLNVAYQIPAGTINDQYDASFHASNPTAVAVGQDGTVYVTDPVRGTITTYTSLGIPLTTINSPLEPIRVATGAGTDVWVVSNTSGQPLLRLNPTNTGYTQTGYLAPLADSHTSTITSADGTLAIFTGYTWDGYAHPLSTYNNTVTLVDIDTPNAGDPYRNVGAALPIITLPTTADQFNTAIITSPTGTVYLTSKNTLTVLTPAPVTVAAGPYAPAPGYTLTGTDTTTGTVTGHLDVTDLTGNPVTYALVGDPTGGTVVLHPGGVFTYTPTPEARTAAGTTNTTPGPTTDTFTITATSSGITLAITITTPISPTAAPPVIADPAYTLDVPDATTGTQTGALHAGSATRTLTYTATPPVHGDLTVNPDGTFIYTPHQDARDNLANGTGPTTDTATVTITDGLNPAVTVTLTLTITPTPPTDPTNNHPPIAGNPGYTITAVDARTGAIHGQLDVTDPDVSDVLSYSVSVAPGRGTVVVDADGGFVYTPSVASRLVPAAGDTDGFTVSVTDGASDPVEIAVTDITITKAALVHAGDFGIVNDTGHWLALSPDGTRLYITNTTMGSIKVLDADPGSPGLGTVIVTIPIANATALAVAPDGKHLYVAATSTTLPGFAGLDTAYIATVDVDEASATYGGIVNTAAFANQYQISSLATSSDGAYLYAAGYKISGSTTVEGALFTIDTVDFARTGTVLAQGSTPSRPTSVAVADDGTVWVTDMLTHKITTVSRFGGVILATTTVPAAGYARTVFAGLDNSIWAVSPNLAPSLLYITSPGSFAQIGSAAHSGGFGAISPDHTLIYLSEGGQLKLVDVDIHNPGDPGRDLGVAIATYPLPGAFGAAVTAADGTVYLITGSDTLTVFTPQPVEA